MYYFVYEQEAHVLKLQSVELTSASQRSTFSAHRSMTHVVALRSWPRTEMMSNSQTAHTKYGAVFEINMAPALSFESAVARARA